ncbi:MAG TPA: hypothetical protein VF731_07305 [Solirubrobacterales bacterium]
MDLFDCPSCERRYLTEDAEALASLRCPECGEHMRLAVRELPGSERALSSALEAELIPIDERDPGGEGARHEREHRRWQRRAERDTTDYIAGIATRRRGH